MPPLAQHIIAAIAILGALLMLHQGLHQSWTVLLCASNSSYAQKVGAKVGSLFEVRFFSIVFAHLAHSTGGDGGIVNLLENKEMR